MENNLQQQPTSASDAGNNFPPEIIEAILRLLPAKPLGRFKSVSKTWYSLISDPQFIKNHTHHHQNPKTTNLILVSDRKSLYSISLPHLNTPVTAKQLSFQSPPLIQWEEILGSCNGILLAFDVKGSIFLMNPTTKELREVPSPPSEHPRTKLCVGYDSFTDDYKVVWQFRDSEASDLYATVFSLRKNSWKKLSKFSFGHVSFDGFSGFSSIKNITGGSYVVVELGGKLGVSLNSGVCYELWVMQEYGNCKSWTRVISHEFRNYVRPVCFVEGNNRDIVMYGGGEAFVFNIDERRSRNLQIMGGPTRYAIEGTFVESAYKHSYNTLTFN